MISYFLIDIVLAFLQILWFYIQHILEHFWRLCLTYHCFYTFYRAPQVIQYLFFVVFFWWGGGDPVFNHSNCFKKNVCFLKIYKLEFFWWQYPNIPCRLFTNLFGLFLFSFLFLFFFTIELIDNENFAHVCCRVREIFSFIH